MRFHLGINAKPDARDWIAKETHIHKIIAVRYTIPLPQIHALLRTAFVQWGLLFQVQLLLRLVKPKQKVVAMCGDGGFLMNVQELETAVRLKLPIIVVIWCDCSFGMISLKQSMEYGRTVFTRFLTGYQSQFDDQFVVLSKLFSFQGMVVFSKSFLT